MAQKKRKKRHSQDVMNAKRQAAQAQWEKEKREYDSKRMDPTARALLLGDLVFLAAGQILYANEVISDVASGVCTVVGTLLLLLALWFQFGKKGKDTKGNGGPKL